MPYRNGTGAPMRSCFVLLLLAFCPGACALNPSLDVSQYAHAAWLIRDGFPKGAVRAIRQTTDGYLWLGTEFGLERFDGVRNVPWPPSGQHLPSNNIRSLLVARDGTLWIGTLEGLASWKDGKLTIYPEFAKQNVLSLVEDREGTVWAGTFGVTAAKLCAVRAGKVTCYGQDGSLGEFVYSLCEDRAGRLWAGTMSGLWQWRPGPPRRYELPYFIDSGQSILEDESRTGLLFVSRGIRRMVNGQVADYPLPGVRWPYTPLNILRDRDGGLWVGTVEHGLLHSYRGRTDAFGQRDGLSGDRVLCSYEDREGNIWVATADGLDRFRAFVATSISVRQGLSAPSAMTALVAHDGAVWITTQDGLNKWDRGELSIYTTPDWHTAAPGDQQTSQRIPVFTEPALRDKEVGSLYEDDRHRLWVTGYNGISRIENGRFTRLPDVPGGYVNAIAGDGGDGVWIGYQDRGLNHVVQDRVVEKVPWSTLAHGVASTITLDPQKKGLWIGFFDGGLVHFDGDQVRESYGSREGLGTGRVMGLDVDGDGSVWAATEGGVSRIHNGRIETMTSANGLPCDGVHWAAQQADAFWLYTPCGLVRVPRAEVDAWISQPKRIVQRTVFDASDGVRIKALLTGYTPRMSQSADGKIWFAHLDSVSVIDPRQLPYNSLPPPVYVEQVVADGKQYDLNRGIGLSAQVRDVRIDYTALSLVAPDKIHFKYKLEGQDQDWKEVVNVRQAQYTNLKPRHYRFHVIASNNSGVWNAAGATLEFSVAPAFFQTNWFLAACAGAVLALLWGLHQLRLRRIAREFNANLEGRVDERLRVARDLHDTLLQSFQGLMLHLQVVDDLLPEGKAKQQLEQTLERADQAIAEGRSAVYGLRSSATISNDLAQAVKAVGDELGKDTAAFRLVVEGPARDLHPIIRDEVYCIAREALRNAFSHSSARRIEAELAYGDSAFRLRIRDDGEGIPPGTLNDGRPGHYGLHGMRERARQIGGKVEIWSGPGAGTEIAFSIPGSIAYGTSAASSLLRLFRKKTQRPTS